jgi:DNA-binding Xre family transcriptional regulator
MCEMRKPVKINIKNFQAIEDIDIDVDGFTCITGKTNIGKSSILRAISASLLNASIVGKVRYGCKYSSISVKSEDWGYIWEKGDSVSRYWLKDDEKPKTALGQGQTEFTSKLGFSSIKVGDEKILPWYSGQHNPLFLINKPGSSVTEFISEVSRLKVLQDAISINIKKKDSLSRETKINEEKLTSLKSEVDKFSNFKIIEKVCPDLERQFESICIYDEKIEKCERLSKNVDEVKEIIEKVNGIESVKISNLDINTSILTSLVDLNQNLEKYAKRIIPIKSISKVLIPKDIDTISTSELLLKTLRCEAEVNELSGIEKVNIEDADFDYPTLQKLVMLRDNITKYKLSLSDSSKIESLKLKDCLIGEISNRLEVYRNILKVNVEIEEMKNRLHNIEKDSLIIDTEISKIPTCPTCSQVTSEDHC